MHGMHLCHDCWGGVVTGTLQLGAAAPARGPTACTAAVHPTAVPGLSDMTQSVSLRRLWNGWLSVWQAGVGGVQAAEAPPAVEPEGSDAEAAQAPALPLGHPCEPTAAFLA